MQVQKNRNIKIEKLPHKECYSIVEKEAEDDVGQFFTPLKTFSFLEIQVPNYLILRLGGKPR